MKNKLKAFLLGVLRFTPFTACAVFMVAYLFGGKAFTVEEILNFTPHDKVFAALFMVLLYALKSITVFFPVSVLNIATGFLFTPFHAFIVSSAGVVAEMSVPYWLGRLTGKNFAQKQLEKFVDISDFMKWNQTNNFFKAAIVRFIYIIPRDSVSRYFGATKMPFGVYLLGSVAGALPSMIATTLLGINITAPTSPMFWVSLSVTVSITAISVLIYYFRKKNKKNDVNTVEIE